MWLKGDDIVSNSSIRHLQDGAEISKRGGDTTSHESSKSMPDFIKHQLEQSKQSKDSRK